MPPETFPLFIISSHQPLKKYYLFVMPPETFPLFIISSHQPLKKILFVCYAS